MPPQLSCYKPPVRPESDYGHAERVGGYPPPVTEEELDFGYSFLLDCSYALPIPTVGERDLWDSLEPKEALEAIVSLRRLVYYGLSRTLHEAEATKGPTLHATFELFLMLHTFYAIADKLATRCPEARLEGFAMPFVLDLYLLPLKCGSRAFPSAGITEDLSRSAAILEKDVKRQAGESSAPSLRSSMWKDLCERRETNPHEDLQGQGQCHIRYLEPFLAGSICNGRRCLSLNSCKPLSALPPAYHQLYYFPFSATPFSQPRVLPF